MEWTWLASVSGFAVAMAGTPGPNNTLVTASGANFGFRRTLPLNAGIATGVACIILAVAAMGVHLVANPTFGAVLKWTGAAYLLWLAWRIGNASPLQRSTEMAPDGGARPLTFVQGALFQLVNPKLWVMASGAAVAYGGAGTGVDGIVMPVLFAAIFGSATLVSTLLWTLVGIGAARLVAGERGMRAFNCVMAVLLVASLIPVLLG